MPAVLALYEDVLADGAALALPAAARMIFLVHGGATIAGRALRDGEAWHGEAAATVVASATGATCWRFDFASPPAGTPAGVSSRQKLSAPLDTLPAGELLLRGDSVAFPPGGCAHPHRHQGPGIRCLIEVASTPPAARPHTAPAARGTRAGRSRCSRKRRIVRAASSA